ncbi:hypothetical protein [Guptibacillus sedimenti]|uniref:hypothetical protein n=1 Tax=Guptibacillus sedimenti TaxID=3025680 RepID=UPI00236052F6|nr:hypothetical protein [Pseudalkalibacillus sedimenti]
MYYSKTQLTRIKDSYCLLFQIENTMKSHAQFTLESEFGVNWLFILKRKYNNQISNKHIPDMHFHEIISLIKMVSLLNKDYQKEQIVDLTKLNKVRNQIAHCTLISHDDYLLLRRVFRNMRKIRSLDTNIN